MKIILCFLLLYVLASSKYFLLVVVQSLSFKEKSVSTINIKSLDSKLENASANFTISIDLGNRLYDDSLSLDALLENNKFIFLMNSTSLNFNMLIQNVNGFLVTPLVLIHNNAFSKLLRKTILFQFVVFSFYNNGSFKPINASSTKEILKSYFFNFNNNNKSQNKTTTTMTMLDHLKLFKGPFQDISVESVAISTSCTFRKPLSSILFKGARIGTISLFRFTNVSIRRHYLEFARDDDDSFDAAAADDDDESHIDAIFMMFVFNLELDERTLNKHVFKHARQFSMFGSIVGIQHDLFRCLKRIKDIGLFLNNLRQFFHSSNDNKWLQSLNADVDVDLRSDGEEEEEKANKKQLILENFLMLRVADLKSTYNYPNEDLCLFRQFPQDRRLVYFLPFENNFRSYKSTLRISTYTFFHLNKNVDFLMHQLLHMNISVTIELENNYGSKLRQMLNSCAVLDSSSSNNSRDNTYQSNSYDNFILFVEYAELIGPILTLPVVSLVGLVTNLLALLTIAHKKNRTSFNENKRLFTYIGANSALNACECTLAAFTLMSECLGTSSVYCSSIGHIDFVKYFYIYVVRYVGDALRMCAQLVMLSFALERFKLTSNKDNWLLNRLIVVDLKKLIASYALISLALCANKLGEYDVSKNFFAQIEYPRLNLQSYLSFSLNLLLYLTRYLLNDLIRHVLNLLVDIALVREIKLNLNKKKLFHKKLLHASNGTNKDAAKKLHDIRKTHKNSNKLIVFSFLVYIICRLPELVVYLYLATKSQEKSDQILMMTFGPLLVNIIQYLYILSYSTNLFFFIKFNNAFKTAFHNLIN